MTLKARIHLELDGEAIGKAHTLNFGDGLTLDLVSYLVTAGVGEVTEFTPSWDGISDLGAGATNVGRYIQIGKLIFVQVSLGFGVSPSISGTIELTNPIEMDSFGENSVLGIAHFGDGGTFYRGQVMFSSTTLARPIALDATGTYLVSANVTSTVPFSWSTNDKLKMTYSYITV